MSLIKSLIKKIFKMIVSSFPSNSIRLFALKICYNNIGNDIYVGERLIIVDKLADKDCLTIGDRVSVAPGVIFVTSSDPNNSKIAPYVKCINGKIVINNDVWVGAGAIILPNLIIGVGAVVAAGAVVTKNVEAYSIVAGVPAIKIGEVAIN
ncbi:acyltransferase [Methanococcoides sp. SA1]|nr:acyltransferase [Methanococcoides sp. SA1]